jgi:uncharacterized protein YqeY
MGLAEQIKADLEQSIRAKDLNRCTTLRSLIASIKYAEIDQLNKALDDVGIGAIVDK